MIWIYRRGIPHKEFLTSKTKKFLSKERNAMECVASGSLEAVHLVTAVLASLISFVAIMALLSGVIDYAGTLIGHPGWSLEMLFGYAFFPIAYLIGVTEFEQALVFNNKRIFLKINF